MHRIIATGAVLLVAGLAAGAAVAFSFTETATGPDAATALLRFERFEGALGTGLGAAEIVEDRQGLARVVARNVGRDPRTVARSVRVSTDSTIGVAAVTATGRDASDAKALAGAYTRELLPLSRNRLLDRVGEARRYVDFRLSEDRSNASAARRRFLAQERRRLDDFLDTVRARRNPTLVQEPQARAAPTSRLALLSGLVAGLGGLILALVVARMAAGRGQASPPSRSHPENSASDASDQELPRDHRGALTR
jgi:hypothetical protein